MTTGTVVYADGSAEALATQLAPAPSARKIREAAMSYIRAGPDSLASGELAAIHREIARRIEQAQAWGFTERDVVLALLRPVFGPREHFCYPAAMNKMHSAG